MFHKSAMEVFFSWFCFVLKLCVSITIETPSSSCCLAQTCQRTTWGLFPWHDMSLSKRKNSFGCRSLERTSFHENESSKVETYVGPRPFRAVVGDDLSGRPRVRVRVLLLLLLLELGLGRGRAQHRPLLHHPCCSCCATTCSNKNYLVKLLQTCWEGCWGGRQFCLAPFKIEFHSHIVTLLVVIANFN